MADKITISIASTTSDTEESLASLRRALELIEELRAIDGMSVVVAGDLAVTARYDVPKPEPFINGSVEGSRFDHREP